VAVFGISPTNNEPTALGASWWSASRTRDGLVAEVTYRTLEGNGVLRSQVRLTNAGQSTVTVESVTSFLGSGLAGPGGELGDVDLLWAENDWLAESRWQVRGLRDALPDLNRSGTVADSRGRFGLTSVGSWSSGTYLPWAAR